MSRSNQMRSFCRPMRRAQGLGAVFAALLIMLLVWTAGAAGASSDPVGITARRLVTIEGQLADDIRLVELVDPEAPDESALAIVWQADRSAWFPTWRVELHSDTGLIPGDGTLSLGIVTPTPDRTYEVVLSYAYESGTMALSIYDVDGQRPVLTREARLEPFHGVLHVGDDAEELATFQPVATRWATLVGPADAYAYSSIAASYDDPVWVRVVTDGLDFGDFLLAVETDDGAQQFVLGPAASGETIYEVPTELLPFGASRIILQYAVDGEVVWQSRPELFRMGLVTGSVDDMRLGSDGSEVELALRLESEAAITDMTFTLTAAWHTMLWDARWGDYRQELHTTYTLPTETVQTDSAKEVVVAARIPVPEADPGLWRIALSLEAQPAVATKLTEREVRISTLTGGILGREEDLGTIRICSYNILGFEGYPNQPTLSYLGGMEDVRRVNHYTHVLRSMGCDIVGIQEGHSVEMMKRIALTWNRNLVAFPSATRFPGGIFTSYPVLETRAFNHAGPANQSQPFSRFAGAALLDIEGNLTWVVNLHAWPHDEDMRVAEAEIIGRHIKELLNVTPNMIVMGDFNSPVGGPFDRVLRQLGLINVMGLSWIGIQPTVVGGQAAIDHIYISSNLVEFVHAGRIHSGIGFDTSNPLGSGEWFNSDHLPVVVELMWP